MPTPHEVFERLSAGIGAGRWNELADLYAEDTVVNQPFSPEPAHIVGREDVRRHFARLNVLPVRLHPHRVVVHDTSDPELIIAEYEYEVRNTATGEASTAANIQVLRIRDGLIVESRDYHDHARLIRAITG